MEELYYAKGTISVTANGFWFTSGCEKGSFGYYPHLKDGNLPVYPDTQIHGDLRMAVSWLLKLKKKDPEDVKKYFGDSPDKVFRDTASKIFITDLKPSNNENNAKRVFIKPRTEIDERRTNKENMLVNFECAYFEKTTLTADIYLAYYQKKQELEDAVKLLKDAECLISGFGAFRSRGFGRGTVEIKFNEPISCCESDDNKMNISNMDGPITLFLKPLVNFRSKQIDPGKGQLLDASNFISSAQFRGWFVKTYKDVFKDWPTAEDMSSITFTDFYPSLYNEEANDGVLGYPPPMSTVKFENGDVVDMWNVTVKPKSDRTKPKPLLSKYFVTAEDSPRLIEIKTDKRMRNSTTTNFLTKLEGGLFAQEFVKVNNYFGGRISITGNNTLFIKNALLILCNKDIKPTINGSIFEKYIFESSMNGMSAMDNPFLVVSAINCDESVWQASKSSHSPVHITITTQQRYNVTLKRPRRNRVVVAPGSILPAAKNGKTIKWNGFSKEIAISSKDEEKTKGTDSISPSPHLDKNKEPKEKFPKMSRSQAGQLREFLSPVMSLDLMGKIVEERLKKYERWKEDGDKINERLIPKKLFTILKEKLKSQEGLTEAKKYIQDVIDEYKLIQWEKEYNKTLKKFNDTANKKGY